MNERNQLRLQQSSLYGKAKKVVLITNIKKRVVILNSMLAMSYGKRQKYKGSDWRPSLLL